MSNHDPFLEEFYLGRKLDLETELQQIEHEIDVFHEQEDADEMEDTYGDLIERRDAVKAEIRELEVQSGS